MRDQIKSWQNIEKETIAKELQRLFSLQDKPLTEDKKALLLDELEQCKLPAGACIAGIRSLVNDDLRSIKFVTLRDAATKFITKMEDTYNCMYCKGHGVVQMRATGPLYPHDTCIGCTCQRGITLANANGFLRWNGEKEQMNGPHTLTYLGMRYN